MPQITVIDSQQQIIDCYIISDELLIELTRTASIFELKLLSINFLKELQSRFSDFITHKSDLENTKEKAEQLFPWYSNLLELIQHLDNLNNTDLLIQL